MGKMIPVEVAEQWCAEERKIVPAHSELESLVRVLGGKAREKDFPVVVEIAEREARREGFEGFAHALRCYSELD